MLKTILNNIFSSRSNISVIRALMHYADGISGREVSRITGYSPKSCHETLTYLEKLNIIKRIRGGRDHIFSLNREHFIFLNVLSPALQAEKNYFSAIKKDLIKHTKKYCSSAYIFGSVAKNKDTIESDFDICLVCENKIKKKNLENEIINIKKTFFTKYGIHISPVLFTRKEFDLRSKNNKPPVKDILKEGILLYSENLKMNPDGKKI